MAFSATTTIEQATAIITLSGELDAASAPIFREQVETVAAAGVSRLVLLMGNLDYMASAGLRVLIFAKQKMGLGVEIILVGLQPLVYDTLEKTGFHHSVTIADAYSLTS